MTYLPPKDIFDFIVNDFEGAWDALAKDSSAKGRGNFMFTMQAMVLLEFGARLCTSDSTSMAIRDWSNELFSKRPLYATKLPGLCCGVSRDFTLPYKNNQGDELLSALWDMVRNGHVHQYQQVVAELRDTYWGFSISGVEIGLTIAEAKRARPASHLGFYRDSDGNIWSIIHPECLFLDVKESIIASNLLNRGLTFSDIRRPRSTLSPHYSFDSTSVEQCFKNAGHFRRS